MDLRHTLAHTAARLRGHAAVAGRRGYLLVGVCAAGVATVLAAVAVATPTSIQTTGIMLSPETPDPQAATADDWNRPRHEIRGQAPVASPDESAGRSGGGSADVAGLDLVVDFAGWAVLDRRSGAIEGSATMGQTSTTASMIKVALVAEYLRRTADAGQRPSSERLAELSLIVRDSDNPLAQQLFAELGEHQAIQRVIDACGLTDSSVVPHYWSNTQLSPRDTARLADCIATGRAVGHSEWTEWLLNEMRLVRPPGDFGIRQAVPAGQQGQVAIKNGWVTRPEDNQWHVNCLAVTDAWAMGVMVRYPMHLGWEHGAEACRTLAAHHLPGATGAA